jgi:uncharacterized protein YbbC (DUF1343 family)
MRVRTGLDRVLSGEGPDLRGSRVGLVAHPASVAADLEYASNALVRMGIRVTALFGPQHGAHGEKQDNMIESASFADGVGRPVYSLYGDVRKPTPEMLEDIDVLLFDLQDVGVRVYTFAWTMTLAMEACRDAGKRFVVLDRPNPIGGAREGAVLQDGFQSFVGLHPVPLRHGLTLGELARMANTAFGIGCELDVVACDGWNRNTWFDDCELPFVMPSPNLPTLDSCTVYPGMVLMEGTNLSEGRGTTRPFELVGAPYLDPDEFAGRLRTLELPGVAFRPCRFEPAFQKYKGKLCGGVQLHVSDRNVFLPVQTAVGILRTAADIAPGAFEWRTPPYEYEYEKAPIDILWGNSELRLGIDGGASVEHLLRDVPRELQQFDQVSRPHLLYT